MALGRGCCCTRATLEALSICVSGSERDGNPSETSERVRMAAYAALEGCLARLGPVPLPLEPVPPPGKEGPEKGPEKAPPPRETIPEKPVAHSVEYYKRVNTLPLAPVVDDARRALAQQQAAVPVMAAPPRPRGEGGLFGLISDAFASSSPAEHRGFTAPMPSMAPQGIGPQPTVPVSPAGEIAPVSALVPAPALMPAPLAAPWAPAAPQKVGPQPTLPVSPARKIDPVSSPVPAPALMPAPLAALPIMPAAPSAVRPKEGTVYSIGPNTPIMPAAPSAVRPKESTVSSIGPSPSPVLSSPVAPTLPSSNPEPDVPQFLKVLRHASGSAERELAAKKLGSGEVRTQEVVDGLLEAIYNDPEHAVRVESIRSLVHVGVGQPGLAPFLEQLKRDPSPRVRAATMEALTIQSTTTEKGDR